MKEKELEEPIEEDGFGDKLKEALTGMNTWRNRTIIPELEKKGMEPPGVKEMQEDVIREAMNKALKSLGGIATALKPRCSNSKKIIKVEARDLQNHIRNFSFENAPVHPLVVLANNVCWMIRHLSGTAEDTTPYAVDHENSVIEQSPLKYYSVCLRLMKTLTANDYGTWLEPPFAKILSACQVVVARAPDLEKTQKGFARLKECVQKVLHFDMQPGVCDYIGLKKLKRKYDVVIQVSARLLAVSCLLDKNALRRMGNPEADKAALDMNIKRALAYEAVAKECNAQDELEVMEKLKKSEAAAKEADAAEGAENEEEGGEEGADAGDE
ncbi:hypothetical protein ACSSS7_002914 [Eimeria intestinalis]